MREPTTMPYIVLNLISDELARSWKVKNARVGFRFYWDETTTLESLEDLVDVVTNEIVGEECNKVFDFDGFIVDAVQESSMQSPFREEKNMITIIKDFIFTYYTRS